MKRIGLIVAILTSATAGGTALADGYPGNGYGDHGGAPDHPRFVLVGEAYVGGWRAPGVIPADGLGRVDRVVLVARDGVALRGVRLTFANGETQLADVHGFLAAGTRTSVDIPGPGRHLRTIELLGGGMRPMHRGYHGYNRDGADGVVRVFAVLAPRRDRWGYGYQQPLPAASGYGPTGTR